MALIKCPDCGKEFSDTAVACPNCGRPHKQVQPVEVRQKTGCLAWGCLSVIVLIVAVSVTSKKPDRSLNDPPNPDLAKYVGPAAPVDAWSIDRERSSMDDSRTVTLSLEASGQIEGWLRATKPTLGIRCAEHKTDLYIHTGMSANPELGHYNQATVRLRLDDGAAFSQLWNEATNNQALFAPEAISLARRLASAKVLRFSFVPFNANRATAEFNLAGLRAHLPELARACGWTF